MKARHPRRRQDGLIVREIAGEVLVYDKPRERALCLNETAAAVWKQCDGRTAPARIAKRLVVDERLVWCALEQLGKDHLLEARVAQPAEMAGMTRRQQLKALGKAAAIAVPAVIAVTAPTAAEASTCAGANAPCLSSTQCCSRVCTNGHCA
jgi:hypothetical protein